MGLMLKKLFQKFKSSHFELTGSTLAAGTVYVGVSGDRTLKL